MDVDATSGGVSANAMSSREGEHVNLANTIDLKIGVKEWLTLLETQMVKTLALLLDDALKKIPSGDDDQLQWIDNFPAQIIILASQIAWNRDIEKALTNGTKITESLSEQLTMLQNQLKRLSQSVLRDMDISLRKKSEQLLTEMVHQRDVTRLLVSSNITGKTDFNWLYHLRYYWDAKQANLLQRLSIRMSNALFYYGFEYLGIT
jgi:dynein heavy chain 1